MVIYCQRTMKEEEIKADAKSIVIMEALKKKKKYSYRTLDEA